MVKTANPIARQGQILTRFLKDNSRITKKNDDETLIDIHIGNPLRRISEILEEIKKQKAFSFTLKGSLGVMGVVLTVSAFGLFGGSKMLCDKGRQSHLGTLHVLQLTKDYPEQSLLTRALKLMTGTPLTQDESSSTPRVVLIKQDETVLHLPNLEAKTEINQQRVIVTGNFDACTLTLKVNKPEDLEKITSPPSN